MNQNGALLVPGARKVSAVDTTGRRLLQWRTGRRAECRNAPWRKLCAQGQSGRFYQRNPQRCLDFHAYFERDLESLWQMFSGRYVLRGGGLSMERIILDTDIGTDVDDVMAVALAAISPELKCRGYYHSLWRRGPARQNVTKRYCTARPGGYSRNGRPGCIAAQLEIWWLGHEARGFLPKPIRFRRPPRCRLHHRYRNETRKRSRSSALGLSPIFLPLYTENRVSVRLCQDTLYGSPSKNAAELVTRPQRIGPPGIAAFFPKRSPIVMRL